VALSAKFSEAVSAMAEVAGVKTTVTVQLAPAATEAAVEHVATVMAKSAAFVPVMLGLLVNVNGAPPEFVSVTAIEAFPGFRGTEEKARDAGRLTSGPAPVPESVTLCGLPPPSSLNTSVADRAPDAAGWKRILTAQFAPGARLAPQVVVSENSVALGPRMAICHKFAATLPAFFNVTVCAALAVPRAWVTKVRPAGEGFIAVATPVRTAV
jgi:hypothetical protein